MSSVDMLHIANDAPCQLVQRPTPFRLGMFRAVDRPQTCAEFVAGHHQALAEHQVFDLDAAHDKWTSNPNVFVVFAESVDAETILAGIRVHLADRRYPLPIEDALRELDSRLYERMFAGPTGRRGEICGLWKSSTMERNNLSERLAVSAIALTHGLNVQRTWGLAPAHTLRFWQSFGYCIDRTLGCDGAFRYPDSRYISHVVRLDTGEFDQLPPAIRRHIAERHVK